MITEHGISSRQACKLLRMPRSTFNYKPVVKDDTAVINHLKELTDKHPAIGFWQSYYRIRRMGYLWNHKRVYRVYTYLKLNIRRRDIAKDCLHVSNKPCSNLKVLTRCGALIL